jgi:hypothetical protein
MDGFVVTCRRGRRGRAYKISPCYRFTVLPFQRVPIFFALRKLSPARRISVTSGKVRISDSSRTSRDFRKVPKAVVSRRGKNPLSKASLCDHLVGDCQELRWKYQADGQLTARRSKLHYALTSGTFGTMPRRGGPSSPPPGGLRFGEERRLALARRGSGSFSGRGLTGPSG